MVLNNNILRLVCDLEYLIGEKCYNPRSYDGYTGEEGCNFRYPVYVENDKGEGIKTRMKIYEKLGTVDAKTFLSAKYRFGANELQIGVGIISVLQELEKRYNLDFCALEEQQKNA